MHVQGQQAKLVHIKEQESFQQHNVTFQIVPATSNSGAGGWHEGSWHESREDLERSGSVVHEEVYPKKGKDEAASLS